MPGVPDYRCVFESDPQASLLLDATLTIVAVSDGYVRVTGLGREALHGRAVFDVPPYLEQPGLSQKLRDLIESMARNRLARVVSLQDAEPSAAYWAWGHVRLIDALDGGSGFVAHTFEDTATSTYTETQRERRLRKLIEHSFDAIALFDEFGRTTFVSPSVQRLLGYTEQEFVDAPPLELLHPDDQEGFGVAMRKLMLEPGGLVVQTLRTRHRDGSWRAYELLSWNLLHDSDVSSIVSNFRDITAHKELSLELQRKNEQLQLALSAASAISWNVDLRTYEAEYSADISQFMGQAEARFGKRVSLTAVHPNDRSGIVQATLQSLTTGQDYRVQFRGPDVDGEPRWYASQGRVVKDASGQPERMIGVIWNVTAQRSLQEERAALERRMQESQKLESLGVLAGGIAHDFNNLLMAIIGNTSLIRRELPAGATGLAYVEQVEVASRRAAELCQQMLAYAGKGRFVLERVALNQLVEDSVQLLRAMISKKAELHVELDSALPRVLVDATQIRQVLMNLVINASEALGAQPGKITVRTGLWQDSATQPRPQAPLGAEIDAGCYAMLQVVDTGDGMTQELKARIFEPFFSTKFTGRGLGLATVLGIARGHRGALDVQSEPGRGTCFSLLLPLPAEHDTRDSVPPPPRRSSFPSASRQGTILVVDDEASVRTVMSEGLKSIGFNVLLANDGRQAIALYREHRRAITCVLMDLTMPEVDGEEAFVELRRLDPNARVLLMSGYNEQEAIGRFIGRGLAGFIHKPFDLEELDERLQSLLA